MPTDKKCANVSLSDDVDAALTYIAERDGVPKATKDADFNEDEVWDNLASKRDTKGAKFVSHDEAWS